MSKMLTTTRVLLRPEHIGKCLKRNNLKLNNACLIDLLCIHLSGINNAKAHQVLSKLMVEGKISYDNEKEYEVEQILDHCEDEEEKKTYFLVKWLGWPTECNTWEPLENLDSCGNIVDLYISNISRRGSRKKLNEHHISKFDNKSSLSCGRMTKIGYLLNQLRGHLNIGNISPEDILNAIDSCYSNPQSVTRSYGGSNLRPKIVPRRRFESTLANREPGFLLKPGTKSYALRRQQVLQVLRIWEEDINRIELEGSKQQKPFYHITVENTVDLEGPPSDFVYVTDYLSGDGVFIPQDPLVGCSCTDCFEERWQCCGSHLEDGGSRGVNLGVRKHGLTFPYTKNGRLRLEHGVPVHECNSCCKCGPQCPFRVVQRGRRIKVILYRTKSRGWGVRTDQAIKRGEFVFEYVGEVVTSEEAEHRGKVYDREAQTYLFDLDFAGDPKYSVDAKSYGNISHFVNHSCDPNLAVHCVFVNCIDYELPRIALFALRNIARNEELTFDYNMTGAMTGGNDNVDGCKSPRIPRIKRNTSLCSPGKLHLEAIVAEDNNDMKSFVHPSTSSCELSDDCSINSSEIALLDDTGSAVLLNQASNSQSKQPPMKQAKTDSLDNDSNTTQIQSSKTNTIGPERIKCLCGSHKCRGWLF